jgi:AraC-like DNA-binding protein
MHDPGFPVPLVERHESDLASWEMSRRRPSPRLAPWVLRYCDYRETTRLPLHRREVATPSVTLIISFGDRLRVRPDGGTGGTFTSFLAGLYDRPVVVEHDGRQHGLQIDLTPLGARALLGLPMHELANRTVELDGVLGARAGVIEDRLASASGPGERFALLDELFPDLFEGRAVTPGMARVWRMLKASDGRVSVADLAEGAGWSRRHLVERFRAEVGLPPKVIARMLRFSLACRLLDEARPGSWADVALAAGYYDQAHFNRDFRALAGCSPRAYLAARLPGDAGFSDGDPSQFPFLQDGERLAG